MYQPATSTFNKPWYKQFWPWFLIVLPGSVVIASLFTIYLAFRHVDAVVSDNEPKAGIEMNKSK